MANLRDVRSRIRSVGQTLQVTKAMKLISTAKLRKARLTLEDAEPFFNRLRENMRDIVDNVGGPVKSKFFRLKSDLGVNRTAVIVITSDRGLAGGFNATIARYAENLCDKLANPFLVVVGSIGQKYFLRSPYNIVENFSFQSRRPEVYDAQEIAEYVISQFTWGVFDEVHVVYTRMKSSVQLVPESIELLPLNAAGFKDKPKSYKVEQPKPIAFEYLPSPGSVLDDLAPLYVKGILYGALVESYASEQCARMTAMDEASKNAEEMLAVLNLTYNRARQSAITQEITEIVAGTTALGK